MPSCSGDSTLPRTCRICSPIMESLQERPRPSCPAQQSARNHLVLRLTFKPGCVNDVIINDPGVLKQRDLVQRQPDSKNENIYKGRSIDITYYDELRRDLPRMSGIEGQLEDPQKTDRKPVYMDHENDILLVGDDPWDEFVTCFQSIKTLSAAEVQQISRDGNLGGNVSIGNPASSGTDSGNALRGHYDDTSAARPSTDQSTCTFNPTLVASHQQKI